MFVRKIIVVAVYSRKSLIMLINETKSPEFYINLFAIFSGRMAACIFVNLLGDVFEVSRR